MVREGSNERGEGVITVKCDYCGKEIQRHPSHVKPHNFCSRKCGGKYASKKYNPEGYAEYRDFSINSARFSVLNEERNPTKMTPEVREKLRNAKYGKGTKHGYRKRYGRHEHRVVAEEMMGRPLRPGEVVHHIDGNRQNNAPENLMVFSSQAEHAAYHAKLKRGEAG